MTALGIHGGRVDVAAVRYPQAPLPWLDLSTGVNPNAWAPAVPVEVDIAALPSPAALSMLETVASGVFGTSPDRVVALPGSEIGLRSLSALGLPSPNRFVFPSYATHRDTFPDAVAVSDAEIDDVTDGTLLLANPNNPNGHSSTANRLLAIARRGPWIVVDEAFADVVPQTSIVPYLQADDRAIVFRSFGKVFGLPGLRLGFMIAPREQVTMMRHRLGSWPVSAHAVAYGLAAYTDTAWLAEARRSIVLRAQRLDTVLAGHGLRTTGDCPLFRLIESDAADAVFDRLAHAGILTRPFDYAPTWLRIGVPADDAAFERLERALSDG